MCGPLGERQSLVAEILRGLRDFVDLPSGTLPGFHKRRAK